MGFMLEQTKKMLNSTRNGKEGNPVVFRLIAQNLASIADGIADTAQYLTDVQETIAAQNEELMVGEPLENMPLTGFQLYPADKKSCTCFMCGGPVNLEEVGGAVFDAEGNVSCACAKCGDRFKVWTETLIDFTRDHAKD